MLYRVDAFQHSPVLQMQVCALAEEQRTAEESALGHYHHPTPALGGKVDHALYGLGLNQRRVALNAVIGQHVLSSKRVYVNARRIVKPLRYRPAVGEHAAAGRHAYAWQQDRKQYKKYLPTHIKTLFKACRAGILQHNQSPNATSWQSDNYKRFSKRRPFSLQKTANGNTKGILLHAKRRPLAQPPITDETP